MDVMVQWTMVQWFILEVLQQKTIRIAADGYKNVCAVDKKEDAVP